METGQVRLRYEQIAQATPTRATLAHFAQRACRKRVNIAYVGVANATAISAAEHVTQFRSTASAYISLHMHTFYFHQIHRIHRSHQRIQHRWH